MRVKNGVNARRRRIKMLKMAKGFRGRSGNTIRQATQRVEKSLCYGTRDRRAKKREFRGIWIVRIGAAAKQNGVSYSELTHGLKKANVELNRKMLSELGALEPLAFTAVAEIAKQQLSAAS